MAVGNLNGKWEVMFKTVISMAIVILPSVIGLNVWFVVSVFGLKEQVTVLTLKVDQLVANDWYTEHDAELDHLKLKQEILAEVKILLDEDY